MNNKNTVYDLVIASMPYTDYLVNPPTGPAVLKGVAEAQGFKILTVDFSLELREFVHNGNDNQYQDHQQYFASNQTIDEVTDIMIPYYYDYIIDRLDSLEFRYFGMSVFSMLTQKAVFELCVELRKRRPDIKIVLGGHGLTSYSHHSISKYIAKEEYKTEFLDIIKTRNLADSFVVGEGENAIIDLLRGNTDKFTHTITWNAANDGLKYPYPNWDDYYLDLYDGLTGKNDIQLSLVSSKGCVRKCDFCNIVQHFPKYQSKDGEFLAEEMAFLSNKYNITSFAFADSIANGNLVSLREFVKHTADYNNANPEKSVTWSGNWIARRKGIVKEDFYVLMKQSGAEHLTVGAEHGSNHVLDAMKKKTDVEGLLYELHHFDINNIQCSLNTITGHWAETAEDFLEHCDAFIKLAPKCASETITNINSHIFKTIWGSPANDNPGIVTGIHDYSLIWYHKDNPNATLKVRLNRYYLFLTMLMYIGIPTNRDQSRWIRHTVQELNDTWQEWNEFAQENVDQKNVNTCPTLSLNDNWIEHVEQRICDFNPQGKVTVNFSAQSVNSNPAMYIKVNDEVVHFDQYSTGDHTVTVEFDNCFDTATSIAIGMNNKNSGDTLVDDSGNILADKCIEFQNLVIDNVDIVKYPDFYYNSGKVSYVVNGKKEQPCPGLYANGVVELQVTYQAPFWKHFMSNSHINFLGCHPSHYEKKITETQEDLKLLKDLISRYEY